LSTAWGRGELVRTVAAMTAHDHRDIEKTGLSEQDAVRKDRAYSPASETETERKQDERVSPNVAGDVDTDAVQVAPGTGGPDDAGQVDVDPEELNLPGR
jgi:hypothetical protein